jgi:hypothetical protein
MLIRPRVSKAEGSDLPPLPAHRVIPIRSFSGFNAKLSGRSKSGVTLYARRGQVHIDAGLERKSSRGDARGAPNANNFQFLHSDC